MTDQELAKRYGFANAQAWRESQDKQTERVRIALMPPRFHNPKKADTK